ncbi:thiol:disulfide interchange protein [Acidithiobacillus thiooxidans]|uniref:Thiol:disulfide interchange protein DsbD n=3 Tax=Acidithiobacillus thiooxidans TaxID=930 RepID=A0A1C2IKK7_ACITH|nr:protein-disulfide reductase DsbD [Acidithiobacillus thiooxidans]OCX68488.1 thiol:disulfide interchange protein [Acidithiobacillus thiooxidans]OCX71223.1 thiol:disulfide interchange protein [Acidithiobacillus thiooxidans]OCX76478.1 thiol:disulfide interchange protein [Acidithiobacillus thiooxidans]OCX84514.1 thiol:disulfide interchange protein [Acidithiobacillus thiooxidans]OCX86182.1 thiol:disulfide interchange protein [Acidithiobacillus thiooxidans]
MVVLQAHRALWARFIILCSAVLLFGLSASYAHADHFLSPDQAFSFSAKLSSPDHLQLRWDVAPGYHLYRDRIQVSVLPTSILLGKYTLPKGVMLNDPAFGKMRVLEGENSVIIPFSVKGTPPDTLTVKATYQGCANAGVCYPEQSKTVQLSLLAPASAPIPTASLPSPHSRSSQVKSSSNAGVLAGALQDSFWLTLGLFFVAGLGLAFTPCIFPMIPILSALIVGQEAKRGAQKSRAFTLSLAYVLGMALTYTIAGVLAAITGAYLQAVFQNPWILGAFASIFVLLALSMFGFYELQMPSSLQTRLSGLGKGGHLFSSFVMGALSALIVGSCVAAPLAGALLFISQTGNVFLGGLSLFVLSLGMGLPLLIIGTSAGRLLPRAGAWMDAVKAIFGVLMLGVAIWLMARVLPGAVSLALWAALAVISSIYLGALDALGAEATGWRRFRKGVGILVLAYGLVMGVGALSGASDPLQPFSRVLEAGKGADRSQQAALHFSIVKSPQALDAALKQADGKPVLVDYWASWCVECARMDKVTFATPEVENALRNRVLIRVDVTRDDANSRALLKRYNLVGPPAFMAIGANGQVQAQQEGYLGPRAFMRWLPKS